VAREIRERGKDGEGLGCCAATAGSGERRRSVEGWVWTACCGYATPRSEGLAGSEWVGLKMIDGVSLGGLFLDDSLAFDSGVRKIALELRDE
jgi:hypothetical protein